MSNKPTTSLKSFASYVLLSVLSLVLFGLTTAVAGVELLAGHAGKMFISFWVYFLLAGYIRAKEGHRRYWLIVLLLLPPTLMHGGIVVMYGYHPAISVPSTLAYFVGAGLGWIAAGQSRRIMTSVLTVSLLLVGWASVYGYKQYLHYLDFDSVSGIIEPVFVSESIAYQDDQGNKVNLSGQSNLIVLDAWNINCGACFVKFPRFEELYQKYQSAGIQFYAANVALRDGDSERARQIISEWEYTFPSILLQTEDAEQLGIEVYPTILIIQNDSLVFRGGIQNAERMLTKYTRNHPNTQSYLFTP